VQASGWVEKYGVVKGALWIVKVVDFLAAILEDSQLWRSSSLIERKDSSCAHTRTAQ